jgi:hypothetical protein
VKETGTSIHGENEGERNKEENGVNKAEGTTKSNQV